MIALKEILTLFHDECIFYTFLSLLKNIVVYSLHFKKTFLVYTKEYLYGLNKLQRAS